METPMQGQPAPGWWNRNWKWFVPTGCCLGTLLGILLAIAVFGVGIFGFISGISKVLKSSEPYQTAIARAKANEKVIAALGTPIKEGFPQGSVNTNKDVSDADIHVSLTGPKGKGTLYVAGYTSDGKWIYSRMLVILEGSNEKIRLIE
jgi:hypothetical protein